MNIAWKQSRYDKGDGDDYINCPLTKSEYFKLIENIKNSPKTEEHRVTKLQSLNSASNEGINKVK